MPQRQQRRDDHVQGGERRQPEIQQDGKPRVLQDKERCIAELTGHHGHAAGHGGLPRLRIEPGGFERQAIVPATAENCQDYLIECCRRHRFPETGRIVERRLHHRGRRGGAEQMTDAGDGGCTAAMHAQDQDGLLHRVCPVRAAERLEVVRQGV